MVVHRAEYVIHVIAPGAEPKREPWQPVYGPERPDRHRVPDRRLSDAAPAVVPA